MNTANPHLDWDRFLAQQESTHDTLHPVERTLQALSGKDGFFEAEIGEYGVESELLSDLIHAAIKREDGGRGSDWDIAQKAKALAQEVIRNRGYEYWERVDAR